MVQVIVLQPPRRLEITITCRHIQVWASQMESVQNELRRKVKAAPKLHQFWVQRTFKAEDPVGMCRVFSSAEKTRNL